MKTTLLGIIFFTIVLNYMNAQEKSSFEFDGQLSTWGIYSPNNEFDIWLGGRYLPRVYYSISLAEDKHLDFEAALNINGNLATQPFYKSETSGDIEPYRLWARYTTNQLELRLGLQKIDFGAATLLRPLQWFNQIDPKDPLKITNGVYGFLGRYYFLNNANIWLWSLYGNEDRRGFDLLETNNKQPEFGGRIQLPLKTGEVAFTYHHKTATSENNLLFGDTEKIPQHRYGFDIKLDVEVGLWLEATYIHNTKNLGQFTHQNYTTLGVDYTFGVGNGLNVIAEHMVSSFNEDAFSFKENTNLSALSMSYPLGLFDNLSGFYYHDWGTANGSVSLNFEHQFKHINAYIIGFYNADNSQQQLIQNDNVINLFTGFGIQFMLVYNH